MYWKQIKCPFFHSDDTRSILCEGAKLHLLFVKDLKARKKKLIGKRNIVCKSKGTKSALYFALPIKNMRCDMKILFVILIVLLVIVTTAVTTVIYKSKKEQIERKIKSVRNEEREQAEEFYNQRKEKIVKHEVNIGMRDFLQGYCIREFLTWPPDEHNKNGGVSVVKWYDGTVTTVALKKGDTYDPEIALMMCVMKKLYGHHFKEVLKKSHK